MATHGILSRFSPEAFREPKEFNRLADGQEEEEDEDEEEEEKEEDEEDEKDEDEN